MTRQHLTPEALAEATGDLEAIGQEQPAPVQADELSPRSLFMTLAAIVLVMALYNIANWSL